MTPISLKKTSPYFLVLALSIFSACTNSVAKEKIAPTKKKTATTKVADSSKIAVQNIEQNDSATSENQTFFIVIADTNINYPTLQTEMYALSNVSKLSVDTMERYFNVKKNLIVLPDNYDDDIYSGDYYPRRFPSTTLSLEYLSLYKESSEKMIALVAGIYEEQKSADSALATIKGFAKQGFVAKSNMYVGCLH